jgi:hypothetical protein
MFLSNFIELQDYHDAKTDLIFNCLNNNYINNYIFN